MQSLILLNFEIIMFVIPDIVIVTEEKRIILIEINHITEIIMIIRVATQPILLWHPLMP